MSAEENKTIVRRYTEELFNKGNLGCRRHAGRAATNWRCPPRR
jgi:hypothetical protein